MPSEFSLIDVFLAGFPRPAGGPRAGVLVGPGDDCAVLAGSREELVVTTDAVVEDVHFTLGGFSLEDVGHKALAVNLSDLAAMGASPGWFLVAIAMPRSFGAREVRRLARGMAPLAADAGICLVGGNFSAARELSLTLTVAGHVPPGEALLRSGARAGDRLYVSGTLGDARLGLELLQRRAEAERGTGGRRLSGSGAVLRQRRPQPRLVLGRLARGYASAAIDLSDGLSQDAAHLARASGLGARIELAALPLSPEMLRARGASAAAWAARGGEDYELLLAVPPDRSPAFERACARAGEQVTRIGALEAGRGVAVLDARGRPLGGLAGHDHFRTRRPTPRRAKEVI